MLHKSFKPAKCKTALKMASSRIKLLKNKREAQLKRLKHELARLLESGQDQTARIRVEHVVREEKMMAAYDLIEIYCELIVARLPIIESQKSCPIDLKEAVSSVIFASPRCADIPELADVQKHFKAKYGKDFVHSAVELHPDCGVSRLLVEKLSVKAPDGPTKIKILSAIAEEHNVKWDPNSFEEKQMKPPEDLLNGPNTFGQASNMHVETPKVQEPHRGESSLQASSQHYVKSDEAAKSYNSNSGSSSHSPSTSSTDIGTNGAMLSSASHQDPVNFGTRVQGMGVRHADDGDDGDNSLGKQSWKMEFKDDAAAAQAAAEYAEMASMAARVAAELASRKKSSRQDSADLQKDAAIGSRREGISNYSDSRMKGEHANKMPMDNLFHETNSGIPHEQSDGDEDELARLSERFNNLKSSLNSRQSVSAQSSGGPMEDSPSSTNSLMTDLHAQKRSSEFDTSYHLDVANSKRESRESEVESDSDACDGMEFEHVHHFDEAGMIKQSSSVSSHSRLESFTDGHGVPNFETQEPSEETFQNPFTIAEGKVHAYSATNSYDRAATVFDDSGDDDDDLYTDSEKAHNNQSSSFTVSSEGKKLSSDSFINSNDLSYEKGVGSSSGKSDAKLILASKEQFSSVFSESVTNDAVPPQHNDLPVAFDNSDGSSSESEEELSHSPKPVKYESRSNVSINSILPSKLSVEKDIPSQEAIVSSEDSDSNEVSGLESAKALNFGSLTGGLRNKGYRHPPYRRNPSGGSALSKKVAGADISGEDHDAQNNQTLQPKVIMKQFSGSPVTFDEPEFNEKPRMRAPVAYEEPKQKEKQRRSRTPVMLVESDSDDLDEKINHNTSSTNQEALYQKPGIQVNKKPASTAVVGSYHDDSEPNQSFATNYRRGTGASQRTKPSLSKFNGNTYFGTSGTKDDEVESKSSLQSSYATDTQPKPQTQIKSSGSWGSSEQHKSAKGMSSKQIPMSKKSSNAESSNRSNYVRDTQNQSDPFKSSSYQKVSVRQGPMDHGTSKPIPESKSSTSHEDSAKSSSTKQLHDYPMAQKSNIVNSVTTSGEAPSRENSTNKASHVHPKLPDYDTFAAHLLSLRQNRQ